MPDMMPSDDRAEHIGRTAFQDYAAELHRFLLRRVGHAADADDLAQEVFMRLLRIKDAERVRKPLAYLYGIASHVVREFRIREDRERVSFDSGAMARLEERPRNFVPDDLADQLHLQRQLERALLQLPPGQRAVLLLVKRDGLSHEEAAKVAGLTVQTVEKYMVNAKARIKMMDWDL